MLGAYASVAILCAASLVVGQAILSLCGRRQLTWLAGPVGLAAILVASAVAIKLPGHGTAVAVTLATLFAFSLATLVSRQRVLRADPTNVRSRDARTVRCTDAERSSGAYPVIAAAAAGLALLIASIPFIVNGRVGILGVGLVNDDMASHLLIADWLNTRVGQMPGLLRHGYPVGPHSLAAGLSEGLGTSLIQAFAGITLATPVLTALVAVEALRDLRSVPRVLAAALVALPYLAAAYLAQGAFKEPMEALLLLSFALLLPRATTVRGALPLGVIAAGAVYTYSFPGLFWLAGTAAVWLLAMVAGSRVVGRRPGKLPRMSATSPRRDIPGAFRDGARRPLLVAAGAAVVLLVLTAPEWSRLIDFTHFRAFRNSTISSGLGNLRHQLSPLEALGIWPASDFRLSASAATAPAPAFYLGALLGAAALALGLPRWIRRHGAAVPAALAAAVVIYLGALAFGTVYTSAKALAIAAPLLTLISLGGLLQRGRRPRTEEAWGADPTNVRSRDVRTVRRMDAERSSGAHPAALLRSALALALAAGVALSSFLVLHQAPVAPSDHADQLAELRPLVAGHRVLFLGRDNFITYELRGSRPFTAVRNYYDPNYVKPNLRLKDVFQKFDFDSVTARTLGRFPFVITTRAAYASGPPAAFEPLRETSDFVLWKRAGPVGERRTLAEGDRPGALLDCSGPHGRRIIGGRGIATVFTAPPVIGGTWSPSPTVESGSISSEALTLARGRWQISISYDATRPLHVTAPGLDASPPANLDYRGSVPYYPVGELTARRRGPIRFTVSVQRPPLAGRLLGTKSVAHLGAIAASPAGPRGPAPGEAERQIPLSHGCGRYVDWYRPPTGR
ncbi:MAG: hypothetical protein E6G48_06710 [Actinobacteria bacterium]|nr:MAG: hypothetical protein E6G48_06710 [Actinomycetota bacterium]